MRNLHWKDKDVFFKVFLCITCSFLTCSQEIGPWKMTLVHNLVYSCLVFSKIAVHKELAIGVLCEQIGGDRLC